MSDADKLLREWAEPAGSEDDFEAWALDWIKRTRNYLNAPPKRDAEAEG